MGIGEKGNNRDIVILCSPLLVEGMADAFRTQIVDSGWDASLIWAGTSARFGQGVIVLEWRGPIPEDFVANLKLDSDCIDYMFYEVPTIEGEFYVGEATVFVPTERLVTMIESASDERSIVVEREEEDRHEIEHAR